VSAGAPAIVIGFPGRAPFRGRKILSSNCSVRKLEYDHILSDCAIDRGNSGGPLLVWNDKEGLWEAVGVTSTQIPGDIPPQGTPYNHTLANRFCNIIMHKDRILRKILEFEGEEI
jgi:hypothetical protein